MFGGGVTSIIYSRQPKIWNVMRASLSYCCSLTLKIKRGIWNVHSIRIFETESRGLDYPGLSRDRSNSAIELLEFGAVNTVDSRVELMLLFSRLVAKNISWKISRNRSYRFTRTAWMQHSSFQYSVLSIRRSRELSSCLYLVHCRRKCCFKPFHRTRQLKMENSKPTETCLPNFAVPAVLRRTLIQFSHLYHLCNRLVTVHVF